MARPFARGLRRGPFRYGHIRNGANGDHVYYDAFIPPQPATTTSIYRDNVRAFSGNDGGLGCAVVHCRIRIAQAPEMGENGKYSRGRFCRCSNADRNSRRRLFILVCLR